MKTHDHSALVKAAREKRLIREREVLEKYKEAARRWETTVADARSTYAELGDAARNASDAMKEMSETVPYLGLPYLTGRQKQ